MNDCVSSPSSRLHVSFGVRDLEEAVAFYSVLFAREPSKRRPGYAKWSLSDPAANVSLVSAPGTEPPPLPRHYGIEVRSREAVAAAAARLEAAGLALEREEGACCYAEQEKVWAVDPDGNRWEVFVVLGEADRLAPAGAECCGPESAPSSATCCGFEPDA